jgi:5-methylcytosine-specific restriction protein A
MRLEFPVRVKKAATKRGDYLCEAHRIWPMFVCYNLSSQHHHIHEAAIGGEPTLENCAALCGRCHKRVTKERRPEMDKTVRLERKQRGWTGRKAKIKSRGFERYE